MKHLEILTLVTLCASPAFAVDLATGDEIIAAIGGNTVQGGMSESGAYTEFYDAAGNIKANGYTGEWSTNGSQMCFDYGEGASCLSVQIKGDQVIWVQDGSEVGTGTILIGNPNGF